MSTLLVATHHESHAHRKIVDIQVFAGVVIIVNQWDVRRICLDTTGKLRDGPGQPSLLGRRYHIALSTVSRHQIKNIPESLSMCLPGASFFRTVVFQVAG